MRWSGICTNRHDFPQPSPDGPEIRSCGTCFARLVGKFTHRGGATTVLEFCLTQSRQAVLGRIFFVRVHPAEARFHRGARHFFQREVAGPAPGVDELVK